MEILSFDKAKEIWNRIIKSEDSTPIGFEFELQEQIINLFHVGPHYYYIFNCGTADFEFIDEKAKQVVGYPIEELSPGYLFSKIHPEDVSYFLNFESTITDFYLNLPIEKMLSFKTSYDVRVKTKHDKYIRVLQQVTPIQTDEQGSIFRTFGVHTDITHIKPEGKPILNIIGLNGESSYYDVQSNATFEPEKPLLTRREQGVLKLIVEGSTSAEIAETLCISLETVKTHRKNILRKSGSRNVAELISQAVDLGWL